MGLMELCTNCQPSYCFRGAYSHARIRENLSGGVTRRMLAESQMPLYSVIGRSTEVNLMN